jgi:hypothetical protein
VVVTDDRVASIDFQLPRRIPEIKISGRTVGPEGMPIPGVSLSLQDPESIGGPDASYATSDDTGRFSLTGLRGRRYRIKGTEVRPGGGESDLIEVTDEAVRAGELTITVKRSR